MLLAILPKFPPTPRTLRQFAGSEAGAGKDQKQREWPFRHGLGPLKGDTQGGQIAPGEPGQEARNPRTRACKSSVAAGPCAGLARYKAGPGPRQGSTEAGHSAAGAQARKALWGPRGRADLGGGGEGQAALTGWGQGSRAEQGSADLVPILAPQTSMPPPVSGNPLGQSRTPQYRHSHCYCRPGG